MNKLINKLLVGGTVLVLAIVGLVSLLSRPTEQLGQAPAGLALRLATSSTISIGQNSVVVMFATTTAVTANTSGADCRSRVVTTKADPVLIKFSPGINGGQYGTTSLQNNEYDAIVPASTTQVFDSGLYGCNAWIAKGAGTASATTTITISEFR